jgi:hypothetical protein
MRLFFAFLCCAVFYIFLAYGPERKSMYVFSPTVLALTGIHFSRSKRYLEAGR